MLPGIAHFGHLVNILFNAGDIRIPTQKQKVIEKVCTPAARAITNDAVSKRHQKYEFVFRFVNNLAP